MHFDLSSPSTRWKTQACVLLMINCALISPQFSDSSHEWMSHWKYLTLGTIVSWNSKFRWAFAVRWHRKALNGQLPMRLRSSVLNNTVLDGWTFLVPSYIKPNPTQTLTVMSSLSPVKNACHVQAWTPNSNPKRRQHILGQAGKSVVRIPRTTPCGKKKWVPQILTSG